MLETEICNYLSLLALPGAGAVSVLRLLRAGGSAAAALELDAATLAALGLRSETIAALLALGGLPDPAASGPCAWLMRNGVELISVNDSRYPPLLAAIACPPPVLFVQGDPGLLLRPQVAMVGSRSPTPSGREAARAIAGELSKYGLTITSGLAIGIDAESHEGALSAGGTTAAVMGTGSDQIYPTRHRSLAARILADGGALVSEFTPGTRPEPANFPRRNRIISGLSLGVLVVEAALPSGSLLTARYASEQNREVMAVPGSIRSPVSRGCHELLRQGAALVEGADDVLAALGDRFRPLLASDQIAAATSTAVLIPGSLSAEERRVLDATGYEVTTLDAVTQRAGLGAAAVGAAAIRLELRGLIVACAGGYARAP
ncbi:MAG: DNA-processing protein DprA [Pseudomonadales bacterium]|nr:DNA-processing protein DprA [Pseudomonadales bacterium]